MTNPSKSLIKIAYFLPKLNYSAQIIYVYNLVKEINDQFDITIYYFDPVVEINFPCNIQLINLRTKIDFTSIDICHSHGFRPDFFIYKNRNKIKGIKISTIHSYLFNDLKATYNKLISIVFGNLWIIFLKNMDFVITLSNHMKLYYEELIPNTRIKFIHTGHNIIPNKSFISEEEICQIINFKSNYKITLGVIANLTSQKGIDQVIKAIALDSNLCLIIIGSGKDYKNLLKLANKLNCINRCLFLGHKYNAYNYMEFFDIYVMSSYQEGFGLVTLEAAYFAIPLLCSNIPIFNEIFSKNEVEFFNFNNPESFLSGVYNLNSNYKQFSKALNSLYLKKYTSKIMGSNYRNIYQNLVLAN